jgi:diadenosine tetraphosphate (Ap4A) HIT family hydrolase
MHNSKTSSPLVGGFMFSISQNSSEKMRINCDIFGKYAQEEDLHKFQKVLDTFKIKYEIGVPDTTVVSPDTHTSYKKNATPKKIFNNNSMQVELFNIPGRVAYFRIVPKNRAAVDNNFFLTRVESFIYALKAAGYLQYVFSQNFGDKSIKVIPVLSRGLEVDIHQKIINAILCCFEEESTLEFNNFLTPSLTKMVLFDNPSDKRFVSLCFPKKNVWWVRVRDLAYNVNQALFSYLLKKHILFAPPSDLQKLEQIKHLLPEKIENKKIEKKNNNEDNKDNKNCAFCEEDVIRNQLVLDVGKLLLLVNFEPYAGAKAHFLILSKEHIEDWSELGENERVILTWVAQGLRRSIMANCRVKETEIISFVQNGVQAGQTVPHSHMHVMTFPQYIPYLIDLYCKAINMKSTQLAPLQMATTAALFKPELFQSLLFSAPPPRLLKFDIEKYVEAVSNLRMFNTYRDRKDSIIKGHQVSDKTKVDYGSEYLGFRFRPGKFGNK